MFPCLSRSALLGHPLVVSLLSARQRIRYSKYRWMTGHVRLAECANYCQEFRGIFFQTWNYPFVLRMETTFEVTVGHVQCCCCSVWSLYSDFRDRMCIIYATCMNN